MQDNDKIVTVKLTPLYLELLECAIDLPLEEQENFIQNCGDEEVIKQHNYLKEHNVIITR